MAKAGKLAKQLETFHDLSKGAKALDKAKDVKKTIKAVNTAKTSKAKVVSEYVDYSKVSKPKLLPGPDYKTPRLEAPPIKGKKSIDRLPDNAQNAYQGYTGVNWKGNYPGQTSGTNAGRKFRNDRMQLPLKDNLGKQITYKEYDVNSKIAGQDRDRQRFVKGSDGSLYYTDSHYKDFIKITE